MKSTLTKKQKVSKEKLLKSKHIDFQECHHCDNKKLTFIEKYKFEDSDDKVKTEDVFFCPVCHCISWDGKDYTHTMFWPNIYNMEKWEKQRGIAPTSAASKWVSDQDLANRKN